MNLESKKLLYVLRDSLETGVTFLDDGKIIAHKDETGNITATRNRCKHQSGRFEKRDGCVLTCSGHGWQLDVSAMRYVNPAGGLRQDQLLAEEAEDGALQFLEVLRAPWEFEPRPKQVLSPGEMTLRFYAHACAEIKCGSKSLFTDPWLIGPAFIRGWWLAQDPPSDWLERLAAADAIYISHNHSDHLNPPTLRLLACRNPDTPIFIPDFESSSCSRLLSRLGLKNITVTPFGEWISLGGAGRFMILQDAAGRHDSGILIEYKGYRILNTVDCKNLCNGILPRADVLLTSFASGASGYPVSWELSATVIAEIIRQKRHANLSLVRDIVKKVGASVYIPFAGDFTEAHPADREVKRLNLKNSAEQACEVVREHCPGTITWIPEPGGVLDLGSLNQAQVPPSRELVKEVKYDFEVYLREIRASQDFRPLQTIEGLREYFRWTGFKGNFVLHVIETSEDFQEVIREFYVDFRDCSISDRRPTREHRYLRMRCRSDVFRYALREGLSWEEISIGFQARFYREPDIYNADFWNHFQNRLPDKTPWCEHQ